MRWSSRCGTTKSVLMFPFLVSFDALIVQAVVWPVCERLKWPGPSYIRGASHMCDSEMHINITPLICLRCHREKIAREISISLGLPVVRSEQLSAMSSIWEFTMPLLISFLPNSSLEIVFWKCLSFIFLFKGNNDAGNPGNYRFDRINRIQCTAMCSVWCHG